MRAVAPILPSRDLEATKLFDKPLGFHAPERPALHGAPRDSDYGLREFAVVDLEGNLLRIGSFIEPPASQPG